MTQKEIAAQVGVSPSAISQFLHDSYQGNPEILVSKLLRWVKNRDELGRLPVAREPGWVETPTARSIFDAMTFARVRPTIAVVYGGAGVGKTSAIREYASAYQNVYVVTVQPAVASMLNILGEIAAVMNVYPGGLQRRSLVHGIEDSLAGRPQSLLVIDEAQHLGLEATEQIRSIHDATGAGLVLCGNEAVYSRLRPGGRRADFAQLSSRVGRRLKIDMPTPEDVAEILQAWNVTGAQEREYAHQIASLPGGLRGLGNMLHESALAAKGLGRPLDVQLMRQSWKELGANA